MRIETERLRLRPWLERDAAPFAVINADPEVRRYYYPAILTPAETAGMIAECDAHLRRHGFAYVALERKVDAAVIGGLGLSIAGDDIPGGPHVEIGWTSGAPIGATVMRLRPPVPACNMAGQHSALPKSSATPRRSTIHRGR